RGRYGDADPATPTSGTGPGIVTGGRQRGLGVGAPYIKMPLPRVRWLPGGACLRADLGAGRGRVRRCQCCLRERDAVVETVSGEADTYLGHGRGRGRQAGDAEADEYKRQQWITGGLAAHSDRFALVVSGCCSCCGHLE